MSNKASKTTVATVGVTRLVRHQVVMSPEVIAELEEADRLMSDPASFEGALMKVRRDEICDRIIASMQQRMIQACLPEVMPTFLDA